MVFAFSFAVCSNNCTGRGVCDRRTRVCLCEGLYRSSWWRESFLKWWSGSPRPAANCDWHMLAEMAVALAVICWSLLSLYFVYTCCVRYVCLLPLEFSFHSLLSSLHPCHLSPTIHNASIFFMKSGFSFVDHIIVRILILH